MAVKTVDAYVRGLKGWQAEAATALRHAILSVPGLDESVKWAQPVYESNGPVCYFRAHTRHLTFGFWRGAELMALDERLETSGTKMAHLKITAPGEVTPARVAKLVRAATRLNAELGDPTRRRG